MQGSVMDDVERLREVCRAFDEAGASLPPPTDAQVEDEIQQMADDASDYGVTRERLERDARDHTASFWRDWFAMDAVAERTGASVNKLVEVAYYRELGRRNQASRRDQDWETRAA